jgi:predicted nucleic-acid-binding protein
VKGLDTNVIVRYLTRDDPHQTHRATRYIERECTPETPCFVNDIVLCELFWVLSRAYRIDRRKIHHMMETLLTSLEFAFADKLLVWSAQHAYAEGHDFADALIAAINRKHGCAATATFDENASGAIQGYEAAS